METITLEIDAQGAPTVPVLNRLFYESTCLHVNEEASVIVAPVLGTPASAPA